MCRRHNPERALLHRSYTIPEIADLFDIGKSAVTRWIKDGLKPIDRKRPLLFTGAHLRAFVKARMAATKRPLGPGQIFCVACKKVRVPDGGRAELEMVSDTSCNIIGHCPHCARRMFRRVRLSNLNHDCGAITLIPKARDRTCNAAS